MMDTYDVIVVGAGPGGAGAAIEASRRGLRVLMVEKRQEIGSPKRCGEGLSRGAAQRMGIETSPLWIRREIKGATAYSPGGGFVRVDYKDGPEGWVIERKVFDKVLCEMASGAGATIMARTEVTGLVHEDGILSGAWLESQGKRWQARAPLIIAADGVESRIARMAGIDTTLKLSDVASGAQFEMSGVDIDPDRIELYFGTSIAPGGYVWIFPKGERTANVGIGVRKPYAKRRAVEYLREFIESRPGLRKGSVLEVNSGGVPVGGFLESMVTDGMMVVGDAAHQVNPIHGGGIAESFVAGRIAGEVAAEATKAGDFSAGFLSRYNDRWWSERGNMLRKVLKLRVVTEQLSDDDLNWLAGNLKGEDMIDFSKAQGFKMLAKLLMKRPRLIGIAAKLV
jgi:digeranylgeranylglycerophospholipid reductase